MESAELRSVVVDVLAEVLRTSPELDDTENLADRGMTSFESVTLVLALEERFDVSFPDDALLLENFLTVERIMKLVASALGDVTTGRTA